ncbi:hypothetical protein BDV25DRAFT_153476 [Aspergillus avenaceus]|uniref:Uncharacterized protein n=1 Tax=Aspergillus avenaceus TaxID=36643 RepID=A0A5N6TXK5_ASPAV|nr:hypothetical protein BDV25DRAFT_153476 [Aspergillus avenaceus]
MLRLLTAIVLLVSVASAAPSAACIQMCRQEKPDCASGEVASGVEGCWGCCQPVEVDIKN